MYILHFTTYALWCFPPGFSRWLIAELKLKTECWVSSCLFHVYLQASGSTQKAKHIDEGGWLWLEDGTGNVQQRGLLSIWDSFVLKFIARLVERS